MAKYYDTSTVACLLLLAVNIHTYPAYAQDYCYPDGNVIIYSNYDGGYLNINVDEDIPNLKIGITTYEKCEISVTGTYAGNVTEVIYAGYNGNNDHCNPTPPTTSINGVPPGITSIQLYPPVTWPNTNGYSYIICNYSCDSANSQGGCNTPDQIVHYYLTAFGGSLYYHFTQYGCWQGTYLVSDAGNCCIGSGILEPQFSINASFTAANDTLCIKDSLIFNNNSFNSYPGSTFYTWDFGDGTPLETTEEASHIYATPGNYTVTLIAINSTGTASDTFEVELTLINCFTEAATWPGPAGIELISNPVTDEICFNTASGNHEGMHCSLYDQYGRLLFLDQIPKSSQDYCISISGMQVADGWYYVHLHDKELSRSYKVLVQH